MSVFATRYGKGQYRAAEGHVLTAMRGTPLDGTRRGVLWCHPATHLAFLYVDPSVTYVTHGLAIHGWPTLVTDLGGTFTVGNDDSVAAVDDSVTYLATLGADITPVLLTGSSQGAPALLHWAKDNLAAVQAIALIVPAVDLADIYNNDRQGLADDIAAAYGSAGAWLAAEPTHNPINFAAALASIPIWIAYSPNDSVIAEATIHAFAAAHGNTTLYDQGNLDHIISEAAVTAAAAWLAEQ